jgi:hypothetical protein
MTFSEATIWPHTAGSMCQGDAKHPKVPRDPAQQVGWLSKRAFANQDHAEKSDGLNHCNH